MRKRTFTSVATAAALTAAGISVTNNLEKKNNTSQHVVQAATVQTTQSQTPQQQFLSKAAPAATTAASKYGTYPSVMIAQAAVESAWGQSTLSQEPNNNLFGIKGNYNGQSVNMNTGEYGSNGYYTTDAQFRKYPSYTESFGDNGSLLRNGISGSNSYYSGTWVENATSGTQATQGLQGKYATAPNYASTLNSVINSNNLTQYDPVTTKVNETRIIAQTTPVTSAPVDADVIGSIGTAQKGQQVNVSEYISYNNGVSHALTNLGWINSLAFDANKVVTTPATATKTTTTKTAQVSKPVVKTATTTTVAVNKNNTEKKATPVVSTQANNVSAVAAQKTTKQVPAKASLTPDKNGSTEQVKEPAKQVTNVQAVTKQSKAVVATPKRMEANTTKAIVQEHKADNVQQVKATSDSSLAAKSATNKQTVVSTVETKSAVKVADKKQMVENNNITFVNKSDAVTSQNDINNAPAVIKQVKLVYSADGEYGQLGSILNIIAETEYNGEIWYLTSDHKWIPSKYTEELVSVDSINQNNNFDFANMKMEKKIGTLTINSKKDNVVTVWTMPGGKPTGRYLANGTSWRYFRVTKVNGEVWYDLGNNQWVPGKYVYIR